VRVELIPRRNRTTRADKVGHSGYLAHGLDVRSAAKEDAQNPESVDVELLSPQRVRDTLQDDGGDTADDAQQHALLQGVFFNLGPTLGLAALLAPRGRQEPRQGTKGKKA
jgi:hypothetical protein